MRKVSVSTMYLSKPRFQLLKPVAKNEQMETLLISLAYTGALQFFAALRLNVAAIY